MADELATATRVEAEDKVCNFYFLDDNDHHQYCRFDGVRTECLCIMPQTFCEIRDGKQPDQ